MVTMILQEREEDKYDGVGNRKNSKGENKYIYIFYGKNTEI